MSSSISDEQSTADLAPFACGPITTALLKVLIPPLFEIDFVLTVERVLSPVCTTLSPVSRFCPSPANVIPVNSTFESFPLRIVIG